MKRIFVTATGTEVGKTVVSVLLVRQLRQRGHRVRALKPLVTGFDPDAPSGSDPVRLLEALGRPPTTTNIADVSPYRFRAPMSPDMAAIREGRTLAVEDLIASVDAADEAGGDDWLVVEGIGGAMVPIAQGVTVRDWIRGLKMPALVVAASALGTLSHTLCTLEALRCADVKVRGVVVSQSEVEPVPLEETVEAIRLHAGPIPVLGLPRIDELTKDGPDLTQIVC